jgi:V-type H+-transporting ATPase subunit a
LGEGKSPEEKKLSFVYLAGLIDTDSAFSFERLLFRRTRGNVVVVLNDIDAAIENTDKSTLEKKLFILIFRESEFVKRSVISVCKAFGSEVHDVSGDIVEKEENLYVQVKDLKALYNATTAQIELRLGELVEYNKELKASPLAIYSWLFEKEKALFKHLNMFYADKNWFRALCWCPSRRKAEVDGKIEELIKNKVQCTNLHEVKNHELTPPTHFHSNEFLKSFQDIPFTYGIPSYQEANPTVFTSISFPFLFGIMFGDLAHGLILLSLSTYLCLRKDHLIKSKSVLASVLNSRYLFLMMGVFSSFCGLLYNDFAAVPLNFISSCFDVPVDDELRRSDRSCVYPISFDPIWYASSNELAFLNSFKMKFSVIVGISHMLIGVVIKGINTVYFKNSMEFYHEFLPQLILLAGFFGYMIIMIIIKWLTDWELRGQDAPSIITLLIGIPLDGSDPGPVPLYGDGTAQKYIGRIILSNYSITFSHICSLCSLDASSKTYND